MGAGGTHPHGHDADEIHATGAEALLHQRNAAHSTRRTPRPQRQYTYTVWALLRRKEGWRAAVARSLLPQEHRTQHTDAALPRKHHRQKKGSLTAANALLFWSGLRQGVYMEYIEPRTLPGCVERDVVRADSPGLP